MYLVLSRQRDQSLYVGEDVEVKVMDVRGDKVRLGVRAPRSISVHRKEVLDAIHREREEMAVAATAGPNKRAGNPTRSPLDACKEASILLAQSPEKVNLCQIAAVVNAAILMAEPGWDGKLADVAV